MTRFTRHGHAVRCEGDPFATCVDETAAMMVLNALMALETASNRREALEAERSVATVPLVYGRQRHEHEGVLRWVEPLPAAYDNAERGIQSDAANAGLSSPFAAVLPERTVYVRPLAHYTRRECDEMVCSCGLRWGVDEADPHHTTS